MSVPVAGDSDCEDPISQSVLDAYNNSPCGPLSDTTKLPAVVDPCVIGGFGGVSGGTSPLGCHYDQIPYVIHYDGFSGTDGTGGTASSSDPWHLSTSAWGFDDHRWFEQLPEECKEWWFDYFYCGHREFGNGVGFMVVPGIINMNYVEINGTGVPNSSDGKWLLFDPGHENFVTSIKNGAFGVKTPTLIVTPHCTDPNGCKPTCNGTNPLPSPYSYQLAGKYYTIEVGNKDCSSVYSIHMKDPSGNWLPQVLGSKTTFYPTVAGTYQIGVRQDNLGLPTSTNGVYEIPLTPSYMDPQCCQVIKAENCKQYLTVSAACVSIYDQLYYNLVIETTDNLSTIQDFKALNNTKVVSIHFINPNKVKVLYATTDPLPKLDLLVYLQRGGNKLEVLLYDNLTICSGMNGLDDRSAEAAVLPSIDMKLFPNPVENMLNIQMNSSVSTPAKLVVFNSLSAMQVSKDITLTIGENNLSVDMSALPPGFYSVLVHTPETSRNAKFVKIRP